MAIDFDNKLPFYIESAQSENCRSLSTVSYLQLNRDYVNRALRFHSLLIIGFFLSLSSFYSIEIAIIRKWKECWVAFFLPSICRRHNHVKELQFLCYIENESYLILSRNRFQYKHHLLNWCDKSCFASCRRNFAYSFLLMKTSFPRTTRLCV